MKKLTAFIKSRRVDTVRDHLRAMGYPVIKMAYIKDNWQDATRSIFWRDEEYIVDLITNVNIEVILKERDVEEAVRYISKFLYEKDGDNGGYEYALRLKSGIIKEDVVTKGRWVKMQPRQEPVIPEVKPIVKPLEVLEVMNVYS